MVGRSPLLKLQGDERLIALIRKGQHGAFEVLVQRYQSRLHAFCRHMLGSTEDAEDVLQEVFAAAFNAICADERPINARPWLYRIARNRCLNHLRRPVPSGQDSMDIFQRDGGQTTADAVHKREEFRQIVADVQELPETQRTALLLREIDALSYEHISEAMDTTVPSVKSLLVRARVSLAEAAEARLLSCAEVRIELGEAAEGLTKTTAPVRRHLRSCERCRTFRGELRKTNRALAAVLPVGPLIIFKKLLITKFGLGAGATTGGSGAGLAAGAGAGGAGGFISAGLGTIATKAAAGFAAAAIVTAGAVEARHEVTHRGGRHHSALAAAPAAAAPSAVSGSAQVESDGVSGREPLAAASLGRHAAALVAHARPPRADRAKPAPTVEKTPSATALPRGPGPGVTPQPALGTPPVGGTQPAAGGPRPTASEGHSTVTVPAADGQGGMGQPSSQAPPPSGSSPASPPPPPAGSPPPQGSGQPPQG
ncbi:MAG: RNA polymerase sigma factor [Thermoleophilaceae bacterium]